MSSSFACDDGQALDGQQRPHTYELHPRQRRPATPASTRSRHRGRPGFQADPQAGYGQGRLSTPRSPRRCAASTGQERDGVLPDAGGDASGGAV